MIIGKSLTALGGGGLKPEIHVTSKAGALLNLHYKDSSIILQSYQLGESETQHTFVVSVSETAYVVEDVTNGKNVEVLVDAVAVFSVNIYYTYTLTEDDFSSASHITTSTTNFTYTTLTDQVDGSAGVRIVGRNNSTSWQYGSVIIPFEFKAYKTLKLYARKVANHGGINVCVTNNPGTSSDDTLLLDLTYQNAPTSWTEYTIDISDYSDMQYIVLYGGYGDNSGNTTSQTEYCNVRFIP